MSSRDPWSLLERVRHFSIRVETVSAGVRRVAHLGTGVIRVESATSEADSTITWHESGRWIAGPHRGIRFTNTTAWLRQPGQRALALSHLRRGPAAPTLLAMLEPGDAGNWVAAEPHRCGPDIYRPTLDCDEWLLRLLWDVQSPSDSYRLYFHASAVCLDPIPF